MLVKPMGCPIPPGLRTFRRRCEAHRSIRGNALDASFMNSLQDDIVVELACRADVFAKPKCIAPGSKDVCQ
jgi:hypothetical protein